MNIEINGQKPEIKMASLLKICKDLDLKSAADIINAINNCSKVSEKGDKEIVSDMVKYVEIAQTCLFRGFSSAQAITMEMVEEELSDFNKVNEVMSWAMDEIVQVMNPATPN